MDVVATRVFGSALIYINSKLHAAQNLGITPWFALQEFVTPLKAQFGPLSKYNETH